MHTYVYDTSKCAKMARGVNFPYELVLAFYNLLEPESSLDRGLVAISSFSLPAFIV